MSKKKQMDEKKGFGKWHDWMMDADLSYSEFKALLLIYRKAHYKTNTKVKITFTEFLKYINRASVKKTLKSLEDYGFIKIVGNYSFELTGETIKKVIEKQLTYDEKVIEFKKLYEVIEWKSKDELVRLGNKEWIDGVIPENFIDQLIEDIKKYL